MWKNNGGKFTRSNFLRKQLTCPNWDGLLRVCLFSVVLRNCFLNYFCVYLLLEKLINKNTFQLKKKLAWFSRKCFPFILGGKHFPEVVKNLEMSYYLLIISNLILKLLIAIYIFCFEYLFFNFIPYNLIFI